MSNSKLSNTIFVMIFMFVISLLLGFMGIYAINSYFSTQNKMYISPYLVCAIDYSTDNTNWITIFDNYNLKEYINNEFVQQFSATDVSIKTVLESYLSYDESNNEIRNKLYLRVTNYSPNKFIQGRIAECKINNNQLTNLNYNTSFCEPYTDGVNVGNVIEIELPIVIVNSTIAYSFIVEETVEVKFNNSRNLLNENYYTPYGQDAVINLEIAEGAIMPETVVVKSNDVVLESNQFSYDKNNKKITIYYAFIKGDIDITCLVNQTYKINEYLDGDSKPICESALGDTTYNYYVELGEYPQSYVGDETNSTLEDLFNNGTLQTGLTYIDGGTNTIINTNTFSQIIGGVDIQADINTGIKWFLYNNEKYVRSYTISLNETTKFSDEINTFIGNTEFANNNYYKWYKVEPIRWVVIDTVDTDNVLSNNLELDELFYDDYRFYADIMCLTPYTEGLLLISELALDTTTFDLTKSNFDIGRTLYDFLNRGIFATTSGLSSLYSVEPNDNLISYQTLTTEGYNPTYSNISTYTNSAHIFALGFDNSSTYNQADYFGETVSNGNNLGLASPSDYALGHYVFADEDQLLDPEIPCRTYTTKSRARIITSPYWLRSSSFDSSDETADIMNIFGTPISEIFSYTNAIRPSIVFNPPY